MRAAADGRRARRRLVLGDLTPAIAEVGILIQLHLGRARMEASFLSRDGIGQDGLDGLIEFTASPSGGTMSADPDRQATYDQLRERFSNDPEFRAELRANPTGTLQGVLGELTDEERRWIS